MAKDPIPEAAGELTGERRKRFDRAVKANLEQIMGVRGGRLDPLPATASLDDVIATVNAILAKLQ